jgi:hypothetical protein
MGVESARERREGREGGADLVWGKEEAEGVSVALMTDSV